jgi:hypothetical protein
MAQEAGRFHFQLHKPQRPIVEHDDLHGKIQLPERNQAQAEHTNVSQLQFQNTLYLLGGSRDSDRLGAVVKAASNQASTALMIVT